MLFILVNASDSSSAVLLSYFRHCGRIHEVGIHEGHRISHNTFLLTYKALIEIS